MHYTGDDTIVHDAIELAARLGPDVAVGRTTAWRAHHLPLPRELVGDVIDLVVRDPARRIRRSGVRVWRRRTYGEVEALSDALVTSPLQTFCDLASLQPTLPDLVMCGDGLIAAYDEDQASVVEFSHAAAGPGIRLARRAAGLVRANVESPPESLTRIAAMMAGFPEPLVQHDLFDPDDQHVARFDLAWPQWRTALEYDGRYHADDQQRRKDEARRHRVELQDWRLVTVTQDSLADSESSWIPLVAKSVPRGRVPRWARQRRWRSAKTRKVVTPYFTE